MKHEVFEKNSIILLIGILLMVSIGGLVQILPLTRSLGEKVADEPETFVWTDAGGDRVRVEMRGGRCSAFTLERASVNTAADAPPPA